jgi:TPR repeat protein
MWMIKIWNNAKSIPFRFGILTLGGIVLFFVMCFIPPMNDFIYCLKVQAYLGSTSAMFKLVEIDGRQNYYWLLMAANKGNTNAMFEVGNLNQPKPEALVWYKKGAVLGDPGCMGEVAKAYKYGLYGVEKNEEESERWFARAMKIDDEAKRKRGRW